MLWSSRPVAQDEPSKPKASSFRRFEDSLLHVDKSVHAEAINCDGRINIVGTCDRDTFVPEVSREVTDELIAARSQERCRSEISDSCPCCRAVLLVKDLFTVGVQRLF